MDISEDRLRDIVRLVLAQWQAELARPGVWMVCLDEWDERYCDFLKFMQNYPGTVYAVIPETWNEAGYAEKLSRNGCNPRLVYRGSEQLAAGDVSVFPVVTRDLVVKTALCISDTFENAWVSACIAGGSRAAFLQSGLERFSGREPEGYVKRVLEYYRTVLEYGIDICDVRQIDDICRNVR